MLPVDCVLPVFRHNDTVLPPTPISHNVRACACAAGGACVTSVCVWNVVGAGAFSPTARPPPAARPTRPKRAHTPQCRSAAAEVAVAARGPSPACPKPWRFTPVVLRSCDALSGAVAELAIVVAAFSRFVTIGASSPAKKIRRRSSIHQARCPPQRGGPQNSSPVLFYILKYDCALRRIMQLGPYTQRGTRSGSQWRR